MNHPSPAAALNGTRTGHICDRCNRGIRTGDKAILYATYYDADGWIIRRTWCSDCGSKTIDLPTEGADEVLVKAVYWVGRLVGVTTVARSQC